MGFEISVAAGLVSQFTPFSLHTSLLTPRTWKQEIIRSSRDQEASFVWRIFLHSSIGQLFKLRTEAVTGVGGVWSSSENCKENHRVSLPSSSDVADTALIKVFPPYYSKSAQKILHHLDSWATASPAQSMKYIELLRTNCQFNFTLGDWTVNRRFVLLWSRFVCFKSLKVSDCNAGLLAINVLS